MELDKCPLCLDTGKVWVGTNLDITESIYRPCPCEVDEDSFDDE
jgi:hypothetical protein